MKKLLLHICCAPCGSGCLERLLNEEHRDLTLYYSNSNLCSEEEFERRLDSVRILAAHYSVPLLIAPYDHEEWKNSISNALPGYAAEPERGARCRFCFAYSLGRTAHRAELLDMNFATTLTVSPHKDSALIFSVASVYRHFEAYDFKKKDGFRKSIENSKKLGLYRQNFCGCEFSKRD